MPPLRVGIVTEGISSKEVLEKICERRHVRHKALFSQGKPKLFNDFDKLLRVLQESDFRADRFLVVPDLHPERDCKAEVLRWNEAIRQRFPGARLCLPIWQSEAWLIADVDTLRDHFGLAIEESEPDRVGEPSALERLEVAFRRKRGYGRGSAYNKRADGVGIASRMDLEAAAKKSLSLRRFLRLLRE